MERKRNERKGKEQWRQLLLKQEQSGLKIRQFCLREGLNESGFYCWRRRLQIKGKQTGFVRIDRISPAKESVLVITTPNGFRVEAREMEVCIATALKLVRQC